MTAADLERKVAAYRPLVADLARQYEHSKAARRVGAEYDDLEQEGLIFVWRSLAAGHEPSQTLILHRMTNWVRYLNRQRELAGVPYGLLLPFDTDVQIA